MNEQLSTLLQCQRNWDLSKSVPEEHVALFREYMENPPQQQGAKYFNGIIVTNTAAKLDLYKILCAEKPNLNTCTNLQPQVLANLDLIWTHPLEPNTDELNQMFHIGFHSGNICQLATQLGYKTSFTRCGPYTEDSWYEWLEKYGLDIDKHRMYAYTLGIGFANENVPYNVDHVAKIAHAHVPFNRPDIEIIE